ncbi:MAG: excinuclease ABC subunit UvrC [Nitrospinae bacterium]|nr:excinuclease ABC subunit UvrC [Nitrospinota bacterium]
MDLRETLERIPAKPGVYIMKDDREVILYIGKANNLRIRVRSYFRESASLSQRIRNMVSMVSDVGYVVTENEVEALILESNLVKRHKPKFNIILRDDKHYPYLKLSADDIFPYLSIVRRVKKDQGIYFGPYTSAKSLRKTLKLIYRIFRIRQSRDPLNGKPNRRPCLNYQMGRCLAPCAGNVKKEDYEGVVKDVILFLKGRDSELLNNLKRKMEEASVELRYEEAARIRDQISAVEMVIEKQNIISTALEDQDVIGMYRDDGRSNIHILFIRGGKVIGNKNILFNNVDSIPDAEILSSFVRQFYNRDIFIPEGIIVERRIEEREITKEWLSEKRGGRVDIIVPERGRKRELLHMAKENAAIYLKASLNSAVLKKLALEDLKNRLSLTKLPERIEAFDISNIMGAYAVGSMVVFIDGEPAKGEYKRFRIKTVNGIDDYGMMREILMRRYSIKTVTSPGHPSSGWVAPVTSVLPDLIIVDGGKGQLNSLLNVLSELSITEVDTIGIAKGEDRKNPETDTIVLPKSKITPNYSTLILPSNSPGRHLIQKIRDEAHRFAITYHRKFREKDGITSELDEIPSIGAKRKRILLKHFGSLKRIREASVKELANVLHVSEKSAMNLHERLM